MSLLNSDDRDVATAQAKLLGTLRSGTRDEMKHAQTELIAAVAAKTERNRQIRAARTLVAAGRRGRRRPAMVVDPTQMEAA